MSKLEELKTQLLDHGGLFSSAVMDDIAPILLPLPTEKERDSKNIYDPVWRYIRLTEREILILDTPLLQRLRKIRQLGLAHLVFPGANHTRFDHSLGALEAATRMFDKLSETLHIDETWKDSLKKRMRLAALLHDSGHCAFSHAGEKVLGKVFVGEIKAIKQILGDFYNKPAQEPEVAVSNNNRANNISNKPSELIAVMFLLSDAFKAYQTYLAINDEDLLSIAGLILGKAYKLKRKQSTGESIFYNFVKSVISGDLDADKIDYVARDAYFSGIEIAGDVDRLISQLKCVPLPHSDEHKYYKKNDIVYGLGVSRSGVSAVEMFVMTRSYLFERIYGHSKTRAAERFIERQIKQKLTQTKDNETSPVMAMLKKLLINGDDYFLSYSSEALDQIAAHDIPKRALAISRRLMQGYSPFDAKGSPSLLNGWDMFDEIDQNPHEFEAEVIALSGLDPKTSIILDPRTKSPLKEDPAIWVCDAKHDDPEKINKHFDVERYSNAYQDVKEIGWVFSSQTNKAKIAAASALCIFHRTSLVVKDDAYKKAKISMDDIHEAFAEIRKNLKNNPYFSESQNAAYKKTLSLFQLANSDHAFISPQTFKKYLGRPFKDEEKNRVADHLSKTLSSEKIPKCLQPDIENVLKVWYPLLLFKYSLLRAEKRYNLFETEAAFQKELMKYLVDRPPFSNDFVLSEVPQASGVTDIRIKFTEKSANSMPPVIVELKVEKTSFDKIVEKHAKQLFHYLADPDVHHVGFLFFQYQSDTATKDGYDMQFLVQEDAHAGFPRVVIAIGIRATSASASKLK